MSPVGRASPEDACCLVTTAGGILATLQVGHQAQATSHPTDWYRGSLSIHVFRHQLNMILFRRCVTYSDLALDAVTSFIHFWSIYNFFCQFCHLCWFFTSGPSSVMGGCVDNCVCGLCGWLRHGCIRQSDLMTTILFIYPHQLTPPQLTPSMP